AQSRGHRFHFDARAISVTDEPDGAGIPDRILGELEGERTGERGGSDTSSDFDAARAQGKHDAAGGAERAVHACRETGAEIGAHAPRAFEVRTYPNAAVRRAGRRLRPRHWEECHAGLAGCRGVEAAVARDYDLAYEWHERHVRKSARIRPVGHESGDLCRAHLVDVNDSADELDETREAPDELVGVEVLAPAVREPRPRFRIVEELPDAGPVEVMAHVAHAACAGLDGLRPIDIQQTEQKQTERRADVEIVGEQQIHQLFGQRLEGLFECLRREIRGYWARQRAGERTNAREQCARRLKQGRDVLELKAIVRGVLRSG